jgi:hypothetical protein
MTKAIAIYEPIYTTGQVLSEPVFTPLRMQDNSQAAWREFRILVDMYRQGVYKQQHFTGLFSPKFRLKTKITGQEFFDFVEAHDDAEVCIVNPFPQIAYFSFNVWMQGEHAHPGLTATAQTLLNTCGIHWDLARMPRHSHDNLSYGNFWVGTQNFWEEYVGKVLIPVADFLVSQQDSDVAHSVLAETSHTDPAPFLPFIIERLFSTYLALNPQLKVSAYPLSDKTLDYCVTDFEKDIVQYMRPKVDAADKNGQFPPELVTAMNLLCGLSQKYWWAYFSFHPHPHTGRISGSSTVKK